jgi:hypothetical protein
MLALKEIEKQLSEIRKGGFGRVAHNIEVLSTDEVYLRGYLHRLVFDDSENRNGFPPRVMEAILEIYKALPEKTEDIWSLTMLK